MDLLIGGASSVLDVGQSVVHTTNLWTQHRPIGRITYAHKVHCTFGKATKSQQLPELANGSFHLGFNCWWPSPLVIDLGWRGPCLLQRKHLTISLSIMSPLPFALLWVFHPRCHRHRVLERGEFPGPCSLDVLLDLTPVPQETLILLSRRDEDPVKSGGQPSESDFPLLCQTHLVCPIWPSGEGLIDILHFWCAVFFGWRRIPRRQCVTEKGFYVLLVEVPLALGRHVALLLSPRTSGLQCLVPPLGEPENPLAWIQIHIC
mmetsp:Transcript_18772/g.43622  ORF Transcript_18772/g.43622 Transcript_18772/m.43622 type:complete len:261 (+) Transcript_18772:301-1083(+)